MRKGDEGELFMKMKLVMVGANTDKEGITFCLRESNSSISVRVCKNSLLYGFRVKINYYAVKNCL